MGFGGGTGLGAVFGPEDFLDSLGADLLTTYFYKSPYYHSYHVREKAIRFDFYHNQRTGFANHEALHGADRAFLIVPSIFEGAEVMLAHQKSGGFFH